jgi:hypothetical protein
VRLQRLEELEEHAKEQESKFEKEILEEEKVEKDTEDKFGKIEGRMAVRCVVITIMELMLAQKLEERSSSLLQLIGAVQEQLSHGGDDAVPSALSLIMQADSTPDAKHPETSAVNDSVPPVNAAVQNVRHKLTTRSSPANVPSSEPGSDSEGSRFRKRRATQEEKAKEDYRLRRAQRQNAGDTQ